MSVAPWTLAYLCRHPVKSVGFEPLEAVELTAGRALPFDRLWAVTHAQTRADSDGQWLPKSQFLRGVVAAELMAIQARLDPQTLRLTLTHPRAGSLQIAPDDSDDGARLADWVRPFWPAEKPAPVGLRRADAAQPFSDAPAPFVAVLNMASLRALSQRVGADLSMHRFRGNLWLDGLAPWEEFDLLGRDLQIGDVRLRVEERITRCDATSANPQTGRRDIDIPQALERAYDHADFGVYARVVEGGALHSGAPVRMV